MDITLDKTAGKIFIRLRDLPPGQPTHYLAKHGLILYWDGHGMLTGLEIRIPDGEGIELHETGIAMGLPDLPDMPDLRGTWTYPVASPGYAG